MHSLLNGYVAYFRRHALIAEQISLATIHVQFGITVIVAPLLHRAGIHQRLASDNPSIRSGRIVFMGNFDYCDHFSDVTARKNSASCG